MKRYLYLLPFLLLCLTGCKEQRFTYSSSARLAFSTDSVCFDTVFTAQGSSTQQIMVYNPNSNAVRISRVWWANGKCFFANLDGENDINRLHDIEIFGKDSIFLFLRVEIDPYNSSNVPLEVDTLFFETNGNKQGIAVQAYGMDVERIRQKEPFDQLTLTAEKPYLIFDTMRVENSLTVEAGATLYMHTGSHIIVHGDLTAQGTPEQPIRVMGDRTDRLFPKVPYRYASGQWGGIYLERYDSLCGGREIRHQLENIHLLSGQVGIFCYSDNAEHRPRLTLHNARIHNMSAYGIVLENTDAAISNAEISNCASYGIYLSGGSHLMEHLSIANFFGYPYTTLNIHNSSRQDVAAVRLWGLDSDTLRNCIITGAVTPALVVDSLPETGYKGYVAGCYLNCDTLPAEWANTNTYKQDKDTVFMNTYYKYGEYIYYDFHLYQSSPARSIGLPLDNLSLRDRLVTDLEGNTRDALHPDAGCYIHQ
ncbi:MAG: right-handed parallel beta-helix repeat-containing protein [Paludibacteraceae bacterium]|nr:right-handed parallel beta-helix repeat-containing protein [Paludibacteraceae bacterium]